MFHYSTRESDKKNIIFFAFARKNKHLAVAGRKFSLAITGKNGHTLRWFLLSGISGRCDRSRRNKRRLELGF
jgi:hypothetical protein